MSDKGLLHREPSDHELDLDYIKGNSPPPAPGSRSSSAGSRIRKHSSYDEESLQRIYHLRSLSQDTRTRYEHLLALLRAIRHCNKMKSVDEAIAEVISSCCHILECQRATVFMVDNIQEQLVIRQGVGVKDIRIPWDKGIAGTVYTHRIKLNIPDAYEDERFNQETDKKTGFRTHSILCAPIYDADDHVVAVLQVINKVLRLPPGVESGEAGAVCLAEDELLMDHLSLAGRHPSQCHAIRGESARARQVLSLDIVRSLHSDMGVNSLIFAITEKSPGIVDADRGTLYMVDRNRNELWSMQGAVEIRLPMSAGLAGYAASKGEIVNVEDAHLDDRFDASYDKKSGYRTKSVLVMPIFNKPNDGTPREVVGALQLINKLHGGRFTKDDQRMLASFLDIAGSLLNTSQLFAKATRRLSEFGAAADISLNTGAGALKKKKSMPNSPMPAFAEGEEEEEEDDDDDE